MKGRRNQPMQIKITNDHGEDHIYVFEQQAFDAVNAALVINRPLLVRGEPGAGKSQLAMAAAAVFKRTYISFVVSGATEARDLLWSFDGVARLADAQIEGALCGSDDQREAARKTLALKNYIPPGPLWAALNWKSAERQYANFCCKNKCDSKAKEGEPAADSPLSYYENAENAVKNGVVLLIDEIDKADSSVPNGLLEVLGTNRFQPDGLDKYVLGAEPDKGKKPLIIITTNEERILPDAFIRRCLAVTLGLPKGARQEQKNYLVGHAQPNFPELDKQKITINKKEVTILEAAADMVLADRELAEKNNLHPLPGQAEYFDLLRGIKIGVQNTSKEEIGNLLKSLARFTSKKHPEFPKDEDTENP